MRILRIHHLTLAVRDAAKAQATFETLFGAELDGERVEEAFGVRALDLVLGDDTLQLAQPLETDSAVMRFIERRGEGIYSVALEVDSLDGAVAELRERGVRVSDPVDTADGARSAFVAMGMTHGLSVQLIELPQREGAPPAAEEWLPESQPPAEDAASLPEQRPPLDLTPDEWSDTD